MKRTCFIAAFVLSQTACNGVPRPRYPITAAGTALATHNRAREGVQGIRAEARVDQRGSDGRIRGTVLMFVQRPGKVRFDVLTQFGQAAILTSDGAAFAYADLRNKSFLAGPTCPANIARLLSIPMSVQDTTLLLLGGTPIIEHDRAEVEWTDEGLYRLRFSGTGGRQLVDFQLDGRDADARPDSQRLLLRRSVVRNAAGDTLWDITYDDYEGVEGTPMPFEVRVQQPVSGADTLIRFKEIAINVDVPPQAFTQKPRPGMTQEVASCE